MTETFALDPASDDQMLLREVIDFYHRSLQTNRRARDYLASRGIGNPEAIERFRIGFADRSLTRTFPQKRLRRGMKLRTRLEDIGILRNTGHGHFNGSIVFPVFDVDGNVTEIYGRKIGRHLRRGTQIHTYLPRAGKQKSLRDSPRVSRETKPDITDVAGHPVSPSDFRSPRIPTARGVWNASALKDTDEVLLCHSIIEALTWWCAGHRNVTAAYGYDGFTDEHMPAFEQNGVRHVLIAYGNTASGNAASIAIAEQLDRAGIASTRVKYPMGQDANQLACRSRSPSETFSKLLSDARGLPRLTGLSDLGETENRVRFENGTVPRRHAVRHGLPTPAVGSDPPDPATERTNTPPADSTTEAVVTDHEVVVKFDDRRYRIRGLAKNTVYGQLKVNVMATRDGLLHVDTLDLYAARSRAAFIKQGAAELHVDEQSVKKDMGRLLQRLEQLQAEHICTLQAKRERPQYQMSEGEEQKAREVLESPKLVERVLADFAACGVVGEQTNLLVSYLAATSRKLDRPLAVVLQSSSAAGKSSLMDAVLSFIPPEDKVRYSAVTGQSLFYMGDDDLKHKVLAIAEETGAEQAAYALKLLQSDGELTIATTGRDGQTGRIGTQQYRVEGPTSLLLTTTRIDVDEELINRCILLTVNEDRQQTQAIHRQQREAETLSGQFARDVRDKIHSLHHNIQRLLRPLRVVNPYASRLTYLDSRTSTRREHTKFLALIRTIAILYQYQRPLKRANGPGGPFEYIEVTPEDIALANRLAHEVLGQSIDDLPPQTRKLLCLIETMVSETCHRQGTPQTEYRFTRRDVREYTGWGNTQLKVHLRRLEELEYLIVQRGGPGRRMVYELLYDGRGSEGQRRLLGLLDVDQLPASTYDSNRSGQNGHRSGRGRPEVGAKSAPGRTNKIDATPVSSNGNGQPSVKKPEKGNSRQEPVSSKS